MYRIIYYAPQRPYGIIDSYNQIELIAFEAILKSEHIMVVCVVDYARKIILNKCKYYDIHRELVDDLIFTTNKF
jgi:hypothetical protein